MNARASHRNYYVVSILFLGLSACMTFYECMIRFALGQRIFTLGIFFWWFSLSAIVGLIWAILLIRYLFYKEYKTAAKFGVITILFSFFLSTEVALMLMKFRLMFLYILTYYIFEIFGIAFALTLIFSKAGERRWLKMGGILGLILGFCVIVLLVTGSIYQNRFMYGIEKISEWLTLVSVAGPVFYMLNFSDEINSLKSDPDETPTLRISYFLFIIWLLAVALAIFLGVIMISQSTAIL